MPTKREWIIIMSSQSDITKLLKRLESIKLDLYKKNNMLELGKEAARLIKKRTRLGWGVSDHEAKKGKLKVLSASYKKARGKKRPKGPTSASKSNLTNTGEMLDSLKASVKKDGQVEIGFSNSDSEKKAGWVSKDRPFNYISSSEFKQLRKFLQEKLQLIIKK